MTYHHALLAETIARHFDNATIDAYDVDLGLGGLKIQCWVNKVSAVGATSSASLYFSLHGGQVGDAPIFASISGYGPTPEEAIATGACNWACAFGPVLRAGLTDEAVADVQSFEITIEGQQFDVFIDALDRGIAFSSEEPMNERMRETRARFAPEGQWLTQLVLESRGLPLLAAESPTVLSVFVSDAVGNRTVEVKVDGKDWPHISAAFAHVPYEQHPVATMMREFAVVVPASRAPKLARAPIQRTLDGIADLTMHRAAAHWPGWQHHDGVLAPPLPDVTQLEATVGELPADYRDFLIEVAASGAGPGYGLISPHAPFQQTLALGEYHGAEPRGVLALAHAGCGIVWLLVLRGPHRGEVWLDASTSDESVRQVAPSFDAWYRAWLASAVRSSRGFVAWDAMCCSSPRALAQLIDTVQQQGVTELATELPKRVRAGSFAIATLGGDIFSPEQTMNPCEGCLEILGRVGLTSEVFAPGVEPY